MARSKKAAAKAKPAPAPAAQRTGFVLRCLQWVYRPCVLFPAALSLTLLVTWPHLYAWAPDLRGRPEFNLSTERLLLTERSEWIPDDFVARALARADLTEASLLDDDLAERVARAFAAEPWVKQIRSVRKRRDGRVQVDLSFRRPVLMVAASGGMYPVDAEGTLLPPGDFSAEDVSQFPTARNVRSLPSGPAGQTWGDPVIAGAARLALQLHADGSEQSPWRRFGLTAIWLPSAQSAAPPPEELSYELETAGGSRIVWGQPPGSDLLEPSAEVKLERLGYYLQQCGSFETAAGPSRIDITGLDVIRAESLQAGDRGGNGRAR